MWSVHDVMLRVVGAGCDACGWCRDVMLRVVGAGCDAACGRCRM